jgi:hypothetical protein
VRELSSRVIENVRPFAVLRLASIEPDFAGAEESEVLLAESRRALVRARG